MVDAEEDDERLVDRERRARFRREGRLPSSDESYRLSSSDSSSDVSLEADRLDLVEEEEESEEPEETEEDRLFELDRRR